MSYKSDNCLNFYNYNFDDNFIYEDEENNNESSKIKRKNKYSESYKETNKKRKIFNLINNKINSNRTRLKRNDSNFLINISQDEKIIKSYISDSKKDILNNNNSKEKSESTITKNKIKKKLNINNTPSL